MRPVPGVVDAVLARPGRPLGPDARVGMERRFGRDLGAVRVHTDDRAAEAADAVGAAAFTVGSHVVFGRDRYRPGRADGRRLLAHELVHVLQQQAAPQPASQLVVAPVDGPHEIAARRQARALVGTVDARPAASGAVLARQAAPGKAKKGAATTAAGLEKTFSIKVEKGDKAWSENDLADLAWALGKLDKGEQSVIKGYRFLRWTSPETREKADATYKRQGEDECGLHEPDLNTGSFKISMYDDCFYGIAKEVEGKPAVKTDKDPKSGGAIEILHEIGHAMALREERVLYDKSERARKRLDDHAAKFGGIRLPTAKLEKVTRRHEELTAAADAAELAWRAAKQRAAKTAAAIHGKPGAGGKAKADITDYAKKSDAELFAEAYKLFKSQPSVLDQIDPELAEWFRKKGFLDTALSEQPKAPDQPEHPDEPDRPPEPAKTRERGPAP